MNNQMIKKEETPSESENEITTDDGVSESVKEMNDEFEKMGNEILASLDELFGNGKKEETFLRILIYNRY